MIPDEKYTDVIPVAVNIVLSVMDAMVGWRLNPAVEKSHAVDDLRMWPKLVKELDYADHQVNTERNSGQSHRQIKNPTGEGTGTGLPQRCCEIELLALMMDHVRGPEQADGMPQAMVPVIAEIVKNEREYPRGPMIRRKPQGGPMPVNPFVEEDAEETEEHPSTRADDTAAQAVDRVGQVIIARAARAIDQKLQRDKRQKDGHRQSDSFPIQRVHTSAAR